MISIKKLGLIINPIAGMGGRVGLKGTDGYEIYQRAKDLGAVPESPSRGITALEQLLPLKDEVEIITCPGDMGEHEAKALGFNTTLVTSVDKKMTDSKDTIEAAKIMFQQKVDLLMFAGGDGTARDIFSSVGEDLIVIGIPAGVKIHSAVYATSPRSAGELALKYLQDKISSIKEVEVMDIDEDAFREGTVTTRLYGYLKIPFEKRYLQGRKTGTPIGEEASKEAIALRVIDDMQQDLLYIIGPGSTTRPIMEKLGLDNTLLGVDVILNKKLIALDVTEKQLLEYLENKKSKLIITPIGGQGYLLGRGNQQISPRVIRQIGKENIIVVSTKQKINSLNGNPFLTDTGDIEIDDYLNGYTKVMVDYKESIIYKIGF